MRRGKVRAGCDNSPPPPFLPTPAPPLRGKTQVILKEISSLLSLNLSGGLSFSNGYSVSTWAIPGLWVWWYGWYPAACVPLCFGASLKWHWNVVPDQHMDAAGPSNWFPAWYYRSIFKKADFLLCVISEFLRADLWWVLMNFYLMIYSLLKFKPLISMFGGFFSPVTHLGPLCLFFWP